MRKLYTLVLIAILSGWLPASAQVASDETLGDWDEPTTWDCNCVPDFNSGTITISAGTTVTIPDAYTAIADEIVVQGEGVLNISGTLTLNSSGGTDLIIEEADFATTFADGLVTVMTGGLVENLSTIASNANTLDFESGSEYEHARDGGAIPTADFLEGSTVRVTGITSTAPTGLNQTFHHFIWECAAQSASSLFFNGALSTINGDFSILSTNSRFIALGYSSGTLTGTTTVLGDMTISGKSKLIVSTAGTYTLNVDGIFDITADPDGSGNFPLLGTSSGDVTIDVDSHFSFSSARTLRFVASGGTSDLDVAGNLTISNGIFDMSAGSGAGTIIFSGGNFNFTSGTITESSTGSGNITFSRSGVQNFNGGGTFSNTINFTVNSGATLDIDEEEAIAGAGTFTLNGNLNLGSVDPNGALQTGNTGGNIRTTPGARTYGSSSRITYDGATAQVIGDGHPATSGLITTINNAAGVSLLTSTTIGGNLVLTSGNLTVGSNTLTLDANVTANGNFIVVEAGSSLAINGSGNMGNFPFPAGDQTFTNLTLDRASGSVTFANNVTLTGAVNLSNGRLDFSGQTLTLNGTFSATSGALTASSASILNIGGSGAFGTLAFNSGNTLNTLTFDRSSSGTAGLTGTLTITSAFNLTNGDFTNSGTLTMDNGSTVTRNSSAELLGDNLTAATGEFYNVVYTGGTASTGLELPTTTDDDLLDLTINGGPVTLTQSVIVNGDVVLQDGSLEGSTFTITMAGSPAIWARQAGTFTPGTSTVLITGSTTVQGTTARFANLTVDAGATLTANALLNITSNLQFDPASTFNHSSGVIAFVGSGTQVLAGAGQTFNTLRVNKSAGVVQMSSTVNLTNTLEIQSATEVQSSGSLVLISTSDGTTGNARIASLPTGASITGDVTAQRYMSSEGRIYRYISAPVSGAPVSDLQDDFPVTGSFTGATTGCSGCTTNASMFYYDETVAGAESNGYIEFPDAANTETLDVGRGYVPFVRQNILAGPVTIDVTGTVNQGTVNLPVTYTDSDNAADGYNLVGNPYPSTIDWDTGTGWTKTNMSTVIAVRDNGSGGVFQYWNGTTGGLTSGLIAAGQGFWVQAMAASPALQVNELAKSTSTGTFFRMQPMESDVHVLELTLSNGKIADRAFFQFSGTAREELDIYDARKLNNEAFDFSILAPGGLNLAIHASNKIPGKKESIRLRIKDMAKGNYTFSLAKTGRFTGYDYFLLDRYTNKSIDLQENPAYAFAVTSAAATYAADRFELFMFRSKGNADEISAENSLSVEAFPNPVSGRLYVRVTGQSLKEVILFNAMGLVEEEIPMVAISEDTWEGYSDLGARLNGVYILRIIDADGNVSTKKILKK